VLPARDCFFGTYFLGRVFALLLVFLAAAFVFLPGDFADFFGLRSLAAADFLFGCCARALALSTQVGLGFSKNICLRSDLNPSRQK